MPSQDDFLKDNPGIKFGEEIEEQVPVKRVKFDPDTKKTFTTYELEKVKTTYINAPLQKVRCKDGDHVFEVVDGSKGLFRCTNDGCRWVRKVYPSTYMFLAGRLINKKTNMIV